MMGSSIEGLWLEGGWRGWVMRMGLLEGHAARCDGVPGWLVMGRMVQADAGVRLCRHSGLWAYD